MRKLITCFVLSVSLLWGVTAQAGVILGNSHGTVLLTEVMDYQCVHCQRMAPIIDQLMVSHPELKVRIVPVALLNHMSLVEATSSLVMASQHPARWHHYHDALLVKSLDAKTFYRALNASHLASEGFTQAMHQPAVQKQIMAGSSLLQRYPEQSQGKKAMTVPLILIESRCHPDKMAVLHGEASETTLAYGIQEVEHG